MNKHTEKIKGKELNYFKSIRSDFITYSADMLVIRFRITRNFLQSIVNDERYVQKMSKQLRYKERHKYDETYQYNYEAKYGIKEGYMYVVIRFDLHSDRPWCRIECNPNKCFSNSDCLSDIGMLLENSTIYYVDSMDIAMDISVNIRDVSVKKDKRCITRYSRELGNETIYLGKRGKLGNVKVYNKQEESNLSYEMTRIEITIGNPLAYDFLKATHNAIPEIYLYTGKPCDEISEKASLSSTNKVLIKALREHPDRVNLSRELERKKSEKIKSYVLSNAEKVNFDIEIIEKVAHNILDLLELEDSVIFGEWYEVQRNQNQEEEKP